MSEGVIVLGGGGHAKVLMDSLKLLSVPVIGYTVPDMEESPGIIFGVKPLGDDSVILSYPKDRVLLANGIGSIQRNGLRQAIYLRFKKRGYNFFTLVHSSAVISPESSMMEGVQIMAGAIIQPGTRVGENTIINTRSSIDHDCIIGAHVHIAPGVTISGGVSIGDGSHVGSGATIIQGLKVGTNCLVGAGAVVLKDVADGAVVYGVPAREVVK